MKCKREELNPMHINVERVRDCIEILLNVNRSIELVRAHPESNKQNGERVRVHLLSIKFNKLHVTHIKPHTACTCILSWTVEIMRLLPIRDQCENRKSVDVFDVAWSMKTYYVRHLCVQNRTKITENVPDFCTCITSHCTGTIFTESDCVDLKNAALFCCFCVENFFNDTNSNWSLQTVQVWYWLRLSIEQGIYKLFILQRNKYRYT